MAYIGPEPNPGQNREVDDISGSFNGSEVNFTLQVNSQNVSPGSANAIIVSVGGVVQNPGTDYTVAASTLTFTTAPANGLAFFGLVLGQQVDTQSVADGSVTTTKLASGAADLVHDTTPQLGGDLDSNTKNIKLGDSASHGASGDDTLIFGADDDMRIYHDGSNGFISNNTGAFVVQDSHAGANAIIVRKGAEVELLHNNVLACETAADGLAFPSGKGINFNATADASGTGVTAGSETLDDYEEGDFTPTFDAGGGVTFSYNHQYGFYTKIGDTVTFQLYLMGYASSITGGNEGNGVVIQGLPYTLLNHARYYPAFTIGRTYKVQINDNKRLYSYGDSNSTNIRLIQEENDTVGSVLTAVQLDQNPCLLQIGGVYRV